MDELEQEATVATSERGVSDRLHAYPKVYNIGHRVIRELLSGPVVVQEKVDGSQFTFGQIGGALYMRSKGAEIYEATCDKLFKGAVETVGYLHRDGKLVEGWQYRGEVISRPRHNTLTYTRVPIGNIILFDIETALEDRIAPEDLHLLANALGLEAVPTLYEGTIADYASLETYLQLDSCLGGCKIEGVVIKNYARFADDGKQLMGKLVSADFKEQHSRSWKAENPVRADIIEILRQRYRHERRWEKAIEARRDAGLLQDAPQDIGPLIKAIPEDIKAECEEEIKQALFDAFWKDIARGSTSGFAEWYKERIAMNQFKEIENE